MKAQKVLLNNFGLKVMAFILALVTWFYVGEATKMDSDRTLLQKLLSPSDYVAKELTIKPIFVGEVPEDYEFLENNVKVEPERMVVVGSSKLLAKREFIYTLPIDLSEYTKTNTQDVDLKSIARSIDFQKIKVQIFLPIKKIIKPKASSEK